MNVSIVVTGKKVEWMHVYLTKVKPADAKKCAQEIQDNLPRGYRVVVEEDSPECPSGIVLCVHASSSASEANLAQMKIALGCALPNQVLKEGEEKALPQPGTKHMTYQLLPKS